MHCFQLAGFGYISANNLEPIDENFHRNSTLLAFGMRLVLSCGELIIAYIAKCASVQRYAAIFAVLLESLLKKHLFYLFVPLQISLFLALILL